MHRIITVGIIKQCHWNKRSIVEYTFLRFKVLTVVSMKSGRSLHFTLYSYGRRKITPNMVTSQWEGTMQSGIWYAGFNTTLYFMNQRKYKTLVIEAHALISNSMQGRAGFSRHMCHCFIFFPSLPHVTVMVI